MSNLKLEKLLNDIENEITPNGEPVRWCEPVADKIYELRQLLRRIWAARSESTSDTFALHLQSPPRPSGG